MGREGRNMCERMVDGGWVGMMVVDGRGNNGGVVAAAEILQNSFGIA